MSACKTRRWNGGGRTGNLTPRTTGGIHRIRSLSGPWSRAAWRWAVLAATAILAEPSGSAFAELVWDHAPQATIVETITELGTGEYLYSYELTNVDDNRIWHLGVYTAFPTTEVTSFEHIGRASPPQSFSWIDIDRTEFYTRPYEHLCRLYLRFCEHLAEV